MSFNNMSFSVGYYGENYEAINNLINAFYTNNAKTNDLPEAIRDLIQKVCALGGSGSLLNKLEESKNKEQLQDLFKEKIKPIRDYIENQLENGNYDTRLLLTMDMINKYASTKCTTLNTTNPFPSAVSELLKTKELDDPNAISVSFKDPISFCPYPISKNSLFNYSSAAMLSPSLMITAPRNSTNGGIRLWDITQKQPKCIASIDTNKALCGNGHRGTGFQVYNDKLYAGTVDGNSILEIDPTTKEIVEIDMSTSKTKIFKNTIIIGNGTSPSIFSIVSYDRELKRDNIIYEMSKEPCLSDIKIFENKLFALEGNSIFCSALNDLEQTSDFRTVKGRSIIHSEGVTCKFYNGNLYFFEQSRSGCKISKWNNEENKTEEFHLLKNKFIKYYTFGYGRLFFASSGSQKGNTEYVSIFNLQTKEIEEMIAMPMHTDCQFRSSDFLMIELVSMHVEQGKLHLCFEDGQVMIYDLLDQKVKI